MALLRPLSGSGAFGVMSETLTTYGPDSFIGLLTSTLQGSTETTFYVLAVYFGAVQIRRIRHALAAALTADIAGILGAVAAAALGTRYGRMKPLIIGLVMKTKIGWMEKILMVMAYMMMVSFMVMTLVLME